MKKLMLTSSGLENKVLKDKFLEIVGKPADKIKMLFIPTAANGEKDDAYVDLDKKLILETGITTDNFIEYDLDKDVSNISLNKIDVIYVEGGNTFYLVDKVRKTGFDKKIKEMVGRGVVYVGVSAGSILAGPNVGITNPETHYDFGITDYTGLNLTDKVICPHFNKKDEAFINRFKNKHGGEVLRLNDGQALIVLGNKEEVIGQNHKF
jgi:dipeptidase E